MYFNMLHSGVKHRVLTDRNTNLVVGIDGSGARWAKIDVVKKPAAGSTVFGLGRREGQHGLCLLAHEIAAEAKENTYSVVERWISGSPAQLESSHVT